MNSEELAFFLLVAQAGSISAAAIEGGVDISTTSRRVAQLEKSIGYRLFNRSGRGVELTTHGHTLLNYAREVGALLDGARIAMSSALHSGPERIHIAAQPTIAKVLFGPLHHAIHAAYPHSRVRFTEGLAHTILSELQSGSIDVALLYKPAYPGSLAFEPLLYEKLYLLTPVDSKVTPSQIARDGWNSVPLILPSTHHGLRVLIEQLAGRLSQTPNIVLECDASIAVTLDLVRQRCGCTVLPLAAAEADILTGRVQGFPLEGPEAERCVSLMLGKTRMPAADLWALNTLIRNVVVGVVASDGWPGTRPA